MSYNNFEIKKITSIRPYSNLSYIKTLFLPDKNTLSYYYKYQFFKYLQEYNQR